MPRHRFGNLGRRRELGPVMVSKGDVLSCAEFAVNLTRSTDCIQQRFLAGQQAALSLKTGHDRHAADDSVRHFRHPRVIERLRRVGREMIVRVAKKAGIGKHQRLVALIPK